MSRQTSCAGVAAVAIVLIAAAAGCSKDASPVPSASAKVPEVHEREAGALPGARPPAQAPTAAPAGPPFDCNVVLLTVDSLRADMPWAGYPRPIAPRLTALADQAVTYTRAHSVSSYTAMSLGGLLGGRLPSELHRSGFFFGTYRNDILFPQLLRLSGVSTMAVHAHFYLQSAGLEQGFDTWRLVPGITVDGQTDHDITSPQSEQMAEDLLGSPANDSRRFFFWAHFMDPHDQYLRHEGIDWGPAPRDRYDAEVTFTDRYVGKLLDFIASKPWAKRTVVIVTSDHGEEFGEHGMTRHGFQVWETLVHVPLLVLAPGAKPHRIDALRSGLDLAPTILDLFGMPWPTTFEGRSLVKEIYGAPAEDSDVLVDLPATSDSSRRRALLHDHLKLICFDSDGYCQLFDLSRDPLERSPTVRGKDWANMKARYDRAAQAIAEVTPFECTGDCLEADRKKTMAEGVGAGGLASP